MITLGATLILIVLAFMTIGLLLILIEIRQNRAAIKHIHFMINVFMDELVRVTTPVQQEHKDD